MSSKQELPGGFEMCVDLDVRLILPLSLASEVRARADAREEAKRQVFRDKQEQIRAAAEAEGKAEREALGHPPVPEQPAPGFHRVLPDFDKVLQTFSQEAVVSRSPDGDSRRRLRAIGERLAELGADRRVGRPVGWRDAVERLERQMPNFRVPLHLIRDALALAEATGSAPRIPPLLLLGPPGVGKTKFTHALAELMQVPHASLAFDQPTYGGALRGSEKFWGNSECGLLFKLLCLGDVANPIVLLDELDKSVGSNRLNQLDPLAQLHSALEPQTARRIQDISVDVEFDASLVTYVATANDLRGLGAPLLSRFEVFVIEPPSRNEAVDVARLVIEQVLDKLKLTDAVRFEPKCAYVLARMSPRLMQRTAELLVAAAVRNQKDRVSEEDCWTAMGCGDDKPRLH